MQPRCMDVRLWHADTAHPDELEKYYKGEYSLWVEIRSVHTRGVVLVSLELESSEDDRSVCDLLPRLISIEWESFSHQSLSPSLLPCRALVFV